MNDLNQTISQLRILFERENVSRRALDGAGTLGDEAFEERVASRAADDIRWARKMIREMLEELQIYPPRHARHFTKLAEFTTDGAYEQSVFVMTKFPTGTGKRDRELQTAIDVTREAIQLAGFKPRVASDKRYHSLLWDNVELYLLGCGKGVAVVEDGYRPELNPNVALEWGWMKGMGKDVLFLVEEGFRHDRADWSGYLKDTFKWTDPEPGIKDAVRKWLRP